MKLLILLGAMICTISCTGCSSAFLPHNAFRYIPEFSHQEYQHTENGNKGSIEEPATEYEQPAKGENNMNAEPLKQPRSYFSPASIRERYAQHIQDGPIDACDPLLDIAHDTVILMRQDGKSDEEIRATLKSKFHFSDETINALTNN